MLIVYLEPLSLDQHSTLDLWQSRHWLSYWPRSRVYRWDIDCSVCTDWFILFSYLPALDLWWLTNSEHSRIIRDLDSVRDN